MVSEVLTLDSSLRDLDSSLRDPFSKNKLITVSSRALGTNPEIS